MFSKVLVILPIYFALLHCAHSTTISKTVEVGGSVVFHCTLDEAKPAGEISWLIEWSDGATLTVNGHSDDEAVNLSVDISENRGNYRTFYSSETYSTGVFSSNIVHQCKLAISRIDIKDQGHFRCVHDGWFLSRNRGTFFFANLIVAEPIEGSPECLYSTVDGQSSDLTTGSVVNLQCTLEGAALTWFDGSGAVIQPESQDNQNILQYTLKDTDNGANLVCKTVSSGEKQRECQVSPFEQLPNVTITPFTYETIVEVDNTAEFMCCGQGIPEISLYEWYFNGSSATMERFRGTPSGTCGVLHISNLTRKDNNTEILCEVSTYKGLSASAIAIVVIYEEPVKQSTPISFIAVTPGVSTVSSDIVSFSPPFHPKVVGIETSTTMQHADFPNAPSQPPQQSSKIIPLGISLALISVIIAVAIFVFIVYRRRKHGHHRGGLYSSKDQVPLEQQQHVHVAFTIPDLIYQDNDMLIQSHEVDSSKPADKMDQEKNVEGLMYASLDLNDCTDGDEILHPAADEAVMYADVKRC